MKKLSLLLLLLPAIGIAQDTAVVKLNNVLIQSFIKPSKSTTNTKISNFDNYGAETPFIIESAPSVNVSSDNGTPFGYSYLTLRGMSQPHINYTLNGVPLNDSEDMMVYTSNYTNISEYLSSINVYRGAGYSSNGVSSFSGLIKFDSKNLLDAENLKVSAMYGSFNSSKFNASYNSGLNKKIAYFVSTSLTKSDGFRNNSSGSSGSSYFSIGYFDKKDILKFNYLYGNTANQQSWLPVPLGLDVKTNLLGPDEKDDFTQSIAQLQYIHTFNNKLNFTFSPYYKKLDGNYLYDYGGSLNGLKLLENTYGFYSNFDYNVKHLRSSVGVTLNQSSRKHSGFVAPYISKPYYVNSGHKDEFSLYYKSLFTFRRWSLDWDIQVRQTKLNYINQTIVMNLFNNTFLNYKGGVSYNLALNRLLYFSYAKSNREPTRTDMFQDNDNIGYININSVAKVLPESVNDYELGYKTFNKFADFNSQMNVNVFYMNYTNEIGSTNQINYLGIYLRKNIPKSKRYGLEIEYKLENNKYSFSFAGSYMRSEIELKQKTYNAIATPEYIVFGNVSRKFKQLTIGLNYQFTDKSYLTADNDPNYLLNSYTQLDLLLRYRVTNSLNLTFDLLNLSNKNNQVSGNFTSQPNYFYSAGINGYFGIILKL